MDPNGFEEDSSKYILLQPPPSTTCLPFPIQKTFSAHIEGKNLAPEVDEAPPFLTGFGINSTDLMNVPLSRYPETYPFERLKVGNELYNAYSVIIQHI